MKKRKLYKYIPELKEVKDISRYKKIFEDNYSERYKKVGKKAIYSAIAIVYGEMVKEFNDGKIFND